MREEGIGRHMNKESPDDKYIRNMKTKARLFAQLMELWDRKCKDGTLERVVKDWFDKQNFASTDEMDIGKEVDCN